ncbi:Methionine ABC transporter substrate-binding protein [Lachnospiraceae bacterium TWA4]|nr:Methionine ABC transporter substrate-binding protein [Lachnospiraceae bacterium TWA4]
MKKKLLVGLAVAALVVGSLVGCSGGKTDSKTTTAAGGSAASGETKKVTIAATATPHAEILEEAKKALLEKGYDLEITTFDDYVKPNQVVEDGEMDANYFQHITYMNQFNEEQKTHLVNVGEIHYEPFGIYPGKKASLDEVADGDTIAIPNDTTNEARALLLLQDNGFLKLKDGAGLTATVNDIAENPKNLKFEELEAAQIARVKDEVAFVVLNGNFALQAGFSVGKDSLAYEKSDSDAAKSYANVIAVKEGNENNEGIKALVEVLKSDEIKKFIEEKYDGAVIPSN